MQELLKYQEIDAQRRKLENELSQSDERKNAQTMQNYVKDCQTRLSKLENNAGIVMSNYKKASSYIKQVACKIDELSAMAESATPEKLIEIQTAIKGYVENLAKLDKEANNIAYNAKQVAKEVENVMNNAMDAKKKYVTFKQAYDAKRDELLPKINKLKADLEIQKGKVDKTLLEKYNHKVDTKTFPIFVPQKDGRCTGCRMELSSSKMKELDEKHIIECENCSRLIYKE
ncbi:MAG: C4-type zinc ribbon domain-containing protein [Clostridia bacterium]